MNRFFIIIFIITLLPSDTRSKLINYMKRVIKSNNITARKKERKKELEKLFVPNSLTILC